MRLFRQPLVPAMAVLMAFALLVPASAAWAQEEGGERDALEQAAESMRSAEQRLRGGDSGESTQTEQQRVLDLLDQLLEQDQQEQEPGGS